MPTRKKVRIREAQRIVLAPSGEDKIALDVIEAFLSLRYSVTRMEITDSECLRYCVHDVYKRWTKTQRETILRKYGE